MFTINKPITTLKEYAERMNVKKCTLQWYKQFGLITPTGKIGNIFYFDEEYIKEKVEHIANEQKKGKKLEQIRDEMYKIQTT